MKNAIERVDGEESLEDEGRIAPLYTDGEKGEHAFACGIDVGMGSGGGARKIGELEEKLKKVNEERASVFVTSSVQSGTSECQKQLGRNGIEKFSAFARVQATGAVSNRNKT